MLIRDQRLRALTRAILAAAGSEEAEAREVADHLVEANLKGHDSHGVGMIPAYMRNFNLGRLHPNRHASLVQEAGPIAVFDGQMGYGQVVARETMDWGIARARRDGAAIFTLRAAHHVARVGTYGEHVAAAGLILITFVNVVSGPGLVAPFGGREGRMHTNPICIAIPSVDGKPPVILDFATSRVAAGKVRVAYNEKKPMKEGLLIDHAGRATTNPADFFEEPRGAIVSFGEHKGFGLSLIADILGGALSGSGTIQPETPRDRGIVNGMFSIIVAPDRFGEVPVFAHEVSALLDYVKACAPADGTDAVLIAGEPERVSKQRRLADGIPVDDTTWGEILDAAASVGLERDSIKSMAA